MAPVAIENPILNSPFHAPTKHHRFDDEGITDEIVAARRKSAYFVPIAQPRARGARRLFDETPARREENRDINRVRDRVDRWREGGYVDVTHSQISPNSMAIASCELSRLLKCLMGAFGH
ncbi:MAG: hypothetical protein WD690_10140 [Vicinamibacterales bacterium]